MPTRFSNLTTKPCVSIESKKIELDNSKIIFQCIKATFSKFETNDNFGRTFFKVSLNEMTSNVSLSLYKLNITSLSTINETNINNYLGDQLLLFGVTQKDGIVYEDVDGNEMFQTFELTEFDGTYYYSLEKIDQE